MLSINANFQDNGDNKHGTRCAGEVRQIANKCLIINNILNCNYFRLLQLPLTSSVALGLLTTQVLEVSQDYLDILFQLGSFWLFSTRCWLKVRAHTRLSSFRSSSLLKTNAALTKVTNCQHPTSSTLKIQYSKT